MKMINEFPTQFLEMRKSPISKDFKDIEDKFEWFYLKINFDEDNDIKNQCLDARNYLDSCRLLVRNLLECDENIYINRYKQKFEIMDENLGRVEKRINNLEVDTIEKLELKEDVNIIKDSPKIKRYINYLIKCMEGLVYFPLIKTLSYFKDEDETTKDLFLYNIFIELFNSSQSLGSLTAEETRSLRQKGHPLSNPTENVGEEFVKPEELKVEIEGVQQLEEPEVFEDKEKDKLEKNIFGEVVYEFDDENKIEESIQEEESSED